MKKRTSSHALQIDLNLIIQRFIQICRGEESQESLSASLKSNFNIVSRWETGTRQFHWDDFIRIAQLKSWDVSQALTDVTHFQFSKWPTSYEILDTLLVPSSRQILLQHFSKQKINRIASNRTKLTFSDFLFIIECVYGRSLRFLRKFLNDDQVRRLEHFSIRKENLTTLFADDHLCSMIFRVLALKVYQTQKTHSHVFIARLLKVSEQDVVHRLKRLEEMGAVAKKDELYRVVEGYLDAGSKTTLNSKKIINSYRRKILAAAELTENSTEKNPHLTSAYILYNTNAELEKKVFELCRQFYIDLNNLVTKSEPQNHAENVRYIGIDLFYPLGPIPLPLIDDKG